MRILIGWVFRIPVVRLIDFDGEQVLRFVRKRSDGLWAHRMAYGIKVVRLERGGSLSYGGWVSRWEPANKQAENLFSLEGQ